MDRWQTEGWRWRPLSCWLPRRCRRFWLRSPACRMRMRLPVCPRPITAMPSPKPWYPGSTPLPRNHRRTQERGQKPVAPEQQISGGILNVGIDLGTSRSAISSSNGEQFVVDSFVGWPADMVARKVLRRDLLIGRDALDHRTMLDLHRPLERGLLKEGSAKDVEAARELLRHLLSLVSSKTRKGQAVRAVVGVPATALRANKQYLRNALKGVVDNLMIVSEPFAVA